MKKNDLNIFFLLFLSSCQLAGHGGDLECILDALTVKPQEDIDIVVAQFDGWSDTTSLIVVTYYNQSIGGPIACSLKGIYKGEDIYFCHSAIDSFKHNQIPNSISWHRFTPEKIDKDFISPPYDPISIQVEYHVDRKCIIDIIKGKGYVKKSVISKCKCK